MLSSGTQGTRIRIAIGLLILTIFTIAYYITNEDLARFPPAIISTQGKYLVDGANCKIPNTDPFDPSIQKYLAPTTPVVCSTLPPLTKIIQTPSRGHLLAVDQHVTDKYKVVKKHRIQCCYSILTRVNQNRSHYNENADKKYKLHPCQKIKERTTLSNTTEFLYVRCQSVHRRSTTGRIVYENMHAVASKKFPKQIDTRKNEEKINVLVIGIDSVSRLSLRRTMPAVLSYLNKNNWIEMDGYNKIADNTLPNLMAILSGRSMEQLHKECMKGPASKATMDDCPSLWKDFQEKGYLTAYAEDVPSLSTFNYRMTGFVEPPTDYYLRPFMLASHDILQVRQKDGLPVCIGPQSTADMIFNYALDLASTLHNGPNYFGLFWLNSFTHNELNSPAALDLRLLQFLKQLEDVEVYNNTVVLLLSDHGIRFGEIRNSFQGYLEERLPFFFLHIPEKIQKKHPEAVKNLRANRNKLTSPYDVYLTLNTFLGVDKTAKSCPSCLSLTKKISQDRSCPEAGIDPHWCTCPKFHTLQTTLPISKEIGHFLTERVQNRTHYLSMEGKSRPNCAQRKLKEIIRVHRVVNYAHSPDNVEDYLIVIETEPFGLFEATIRKENHNGASNYESLGFISRLDSYFSTSKCTHSKLLQFYCHCV